MKENKYFVIHCVKETGVYVGIHDSERNRSFSTYLPLCLYGGGTIKQPNRIEKLFGVTFEGKVQKAITKLQKFVDWLNIREKQRRVKDAEITKCYTQMNLGEQRR